MSRTYKATGINLKSMPMGESDRLLTILTREYGLIRAVAMGSRKHNSKLGGRSGLFVVNELLIARGRSLDKVTQAETLESYPGLGQDLKKLTASQYLAELSLCQALSDQPQEELFALLNEHLRRLEAAPPDRVLAHLIHAIFQLLILGGVAPQIHLCCMSRQPIEPDLSQPDWRIGFSIPAGGTVTLDALEQLLTAKPRPRAAPSAGDQPVSFPSRGTLSLSPALLNLRITAIDLLLLHQLTQATLPQSSAFPDLFPLPDLAQVEESWRGIERILRHYAQYHFDRPIRSAALIDACFAPAIHP